MTWGHWSNEKIFNESFMPSLCGTASKLPQKNSEHTAPLRNINYLALHECLPCGSCNSHKNGRELLMRLQLQDSLEKSTPMLPQEENNQNNILLKRQTKFVVLGELISLENKYLILLYPQVITLHMRLGVTYDMPPMTIWSCK